MTTPTGTISLSDVNVELGRSSTASINMNESAVRTLAGVGGSGTIISMNDLRGKSNLGATLNNYNAGAYNVQLYRESIVGSGATYARVGITLYSDGTARYFYEDYYTATTNFTSFTWKTGGGSAGDYYARLILDIGSSSPNSSSSATGTDLVLSTTREWKAWADVPITNAEAFYTVSGTLQIKNSAGTVLASKTVVLDAFAMSGVPF
jgi:hypothetical protein